MLPKKIHYCWFGGNPKSELIEKCIDSWRKFCPDYEIIEWNESNYDISKNIFMKEAYDCKKWAFVSDYARLDIVLNNGGIYLDTDVEVFESLDRFLEYDAFFAFETARSIASGLGFAAEKNHKSVKACLDCYENRHFLINGKMDLSPCPRINTEGLISCYTNLQRNGQTQVINNTLFLSSSDYSIYMKHHYSGTWGNDNAERNVHIYKPSKFKSFLRNPSKYNFIEKHFGKKVLRFYEFITYDLMQFGLKH